ncbi:uncharacterized protein LOC129593341 isoform X2 [Paramacrobiotus metropolitanus]|uniref:uncharacterized protein LOC129593341 isoform X2 n=1 Tax=Paramacrobiotus metropolitanus TaxID=2943436 RepID=UPI0024463291|nr:uncharacterized protein LOC129593341 isoform X2 [Paramacrobiotus metropolitanus]
MAPDNQAHSPSTLTRLSNDLQPQKVLKKAKMFVVKIRRAQPIGSADSTFVQAKRKSLSPEFLPPRPTRIRFQQKSTQTGEDTSTPLNPVQSDRIIDDTFSHANYEPTANREGVCAETQTDDDVNRPRIRLINPSPPPSTVPSHSPGPSFVVVKTTKRRRPTIKRVRSQRNCNEVFDGIEPTTVDNFLNTVKLTRTDAVEEATNKRHKPESASRPIATENICKVKKKQPVKKQVTIVAPDIIPSSAEEDIRSTVIKRNRASPRKVSAAPLRRCLVPGCHTELKLPRPSGMRYHGLPNDAGLRRAYLRLCGRDQKISVSGFVCGKHFIATDYEPNGVLKKNALPSVNLSEPGKFCAPEIVVKAAPEFSDLDGRIYITWNQLASPIFRPPLTASDDCSNWVPCASLADCIQFVRLRVRPAGIKEYTLQYSVVDMIQIFRDLSVYLWSDDRLVPRERYIGKLKEFSERELLVMQLERLFRFDFASHDLHDNAGI